MRRNLDASGLGAADVEPLPSERSDVDRCGGGDLPCLVVAFPAYAGPLLLGKIAGVENAVRLLGHAGRKKHQQDWKEP